MKKIFLGFKVLIPTSMLFLAGCGQFLSGGGGGGANSFSNGPPVPFEQFKSIIAKNCNHCHGAVAELYPGISNFEALTTEEAWTSHPMRLVVPGSREFSTVYNRLIHARDIGGDSNRNMPFATAGYPVSMTPAEADAIGRYIEAQGNGDGSLLSIVDNSSGFSSLAKAKLIFNGEAVSDDEIAQVVNRSDESLNRPLMKSLVYSWLDSPQSQDKLLKFFMLNMRQDQWSYPGEAELFGRIRGQGNGDNQNSNRNNWENNLKESFARTVLEIVNSEQNFSEFVSTRQRMVTSAILSSLSFADGEGRPNGFPNNNNRDTFNNHLDGLPASDFNDWRMVNFASSDAVIPFNNMDAIRAVGANGSYNLKIPRVGFFNTLAFQLKNPSNDANDFRTTISETMVVATNEIYQAGDQTPNGSLDALDNEHAGPTTSCYQCHRILDPAREVFRTTYDQFYLYSDGADARTPAFAFMGHAGPAANVSQLADTISRHPLLSKGWASKLCEYINGEACDTAHPEFNRIVRTFEDSNLNFKTLVAELAASPIVTAKGGGVASSSGEFIGSSVSGLISAVRRDHLCAAMNLRYQQVLTITNTPDPLNNQDLCDLSDPVRVNLNGIIDDSVARGESGITISPEISAFGVQSLNNVCGLWAAEMVGNNSAFPANGQEAQSLANMVIYIMGLPRTHPRNSIATSVLTEIFTNARDDVNLNDNQAMEEAFKFACSSPDVAGVGL